MKNRGIMTLLVVLTVVFALVGGTLAYFTWRGSNTAVTFTVSAGFSCGADGGGNITSSDVMLAPSSCTNSTYAIKREIKVMPKLSTGSLYMNLWLNIDKLDTGLANSQNFNYVLSTSSDSCDTGVVASGNFYGMEVGDKVNLFNDKYYSASATDKYYLYIWLDQNETSTNTMNQSFSFSLGGDCGNQSPTEPNAPELYDGLVPVVISDDGTVTVVSSSDSSWYNYSDKKWANAVLIDNSSVIQQSSYKNEELKVQKLNAGVTSISDIAHDYSYYKSHVGATIPENDILAYFVWIPRYKYKIWTTDDDLAEENLSDPQEIDIKFEEATSISVGSKKGDYVTHPAFTFGEKSLSGIWVGKFETSTSEEVSSSGSVESSLKIDDYSLSVLPYNSQKEIVLDKMVGISAVDIGEVNLPTIKPNVNSLYNQSVASQFKTALKFSGGVLSNGNVTFSGNGIYGLSSTTDSHMMKNSEWGAVAYLSHSKYGINSEVRINNYYNSGFLTGCGASEADASSSSTCGIPYGEASSYPQSTTGNISGVFDMSGGAWEYVMGNYGNYSGYASGFNGMLSDGSTYSSGVDFPPSKYYDLYSATQFTGNNNSNIGFCTLATCGGHALSETVWWYSDYALFVSSDGPWFVRGGNGSGGVSAGAFSFHGNDGSGYNDIGFRVVLSS